MSGGNLSHADLQSRQTGLIKSTIISIGNRNHWRTVRSAEHNTQKIRRCMNEMRESPKLDEL
jgi:hypothetical protein